MPSVSIHWPGIVDLAGIGSVSRLLPIWPEDGPGKMNSDCRPGLPQRERTTTLPPAPRARLHQPLTPVTSPAPGECGRLRARRECRDGRGGRCAAPPGQSPPHRAHGPQQQVGPCSLPCYRTFIPHLRWGLCRGGPTPRPGGRTARSAPEGALRITGNWLLRPSVPATAPTEEAVARLPAAEAVGQGPRSS